MISMSPHRGDLPGRYFYPLSVATYDEEEVQAVIDHLTTYRTTMAGTVAHFEEQFAAYVGAKHAVMVNSGSSADLLIALALVNPAYKRLEKGNTVLVPAVTWPTHVWSLMMAGLNVRLVDVDPGTLNVNYDDLERHLDANTKALSIVHLMGNPCEMDRVLDFCHAYGLILLEDCCEALGATCPDRHVGTFGLASAFSFFFSHHLSTLEGGMVCTDDDDLAHLCRLLRNHGWDRSQSGYVFTNWGLNIRPTELAAAMGTVQLRKLPAMLTRRRENYSKFLSLPDAVWMAPHASPFAVPLIVDDRERLAKHLDANGVETRPVVAGNLARQPAARLHHLQHSFMPGADTIDRHGLVVGLHPVDEPGNIARVIELIKEAAA